VPKTLIFTKLSGEADRILDAFAERTGLGATGGAERAIFQLEGAGHAIDAEAELRAVDPAWAEHVRLENPQT
jgi:hypothetical protein